MAERAGTEVLATTSRGRWFVVGALAAAFLLLLAVVAALAGDYVPLNDALHFDQIATSVANGEGYGDHPIPPAAGPGAFRSPLYPAVLGGVYVLFGDHSWTAGLVVNAAIGTVVVGLVGLVASLLWGTRAGGVDEKRMDEITVSANRTDGRAECRFSRRVEAADADAAGVTTARSAAAHSQSEPLERGVSRA